MIFFFAVFWAVDSINRTNSGAHVSEQQDKFFVILLCNGSEITCLTLKKVVLPHIS